MSNSQPTASAHLRVSKETRAPFGDKDRRVRADFKMAIFHLNARSGSRQRNSSAVAKAQYITRSGDYSARKDLVFSVSRNMPTWASGDALAYWIAADEHERKNASLYREYEFALPVELSPERNQALALEFAETICGDTLPFTLAIHDQGTGNPHCHLVLSERALDGHDRTPEIWFKRAATKNRDPQSGGAKKVDLSSKKKLVEIRATWADLANNALKHAQIDARIDHRSHKERDLNLIPQIHLGAATLAFNRKNIRTERNDRYDEIQRINEERQEAINELTRLRNELEAEIQAQQEEGFIFEEQSQEDIVKEARQYVLERLDNFDFDVFAKDQEIEKSFHKTIHQLIEKEFPDLKPHQLEGLKNELDDAWEDRLLEAETELQLQEREAELEAFEQDAKEHGPSWRM